MRYGRQTDRQTDKQTVTHGGVCDYAPEVCQHELAGDAVAEDRCRHVLAVHLEVLDLLEVSLLDHCIMYVPMYLSMLYVSKYAWGCI
jgi:hypothetical protein